MTSRRERRGPLDLLIIQPTPFCNLDCDYCYLPFRQLRDRISSETLGRIFQRVFASDLIDRHFTVVWHAGEPLVLPPAFYEEAIDLIARENVAGIHVTHSIQTNATLLNDRWAEFFKAHVGQLSLGVSVDGPAFLHDRHRKTRQGGGTWKQVVRGLEVLRAHEISFHVITVLTAESLDYPDELFDFYLKHGIRQIAFNVEEIEGPHTVSSMSSTAAEDRYRAFLRRFYEIIEQADERFSVREFDSATGAIFNQRPPDEGCPQQTTPFAIITVDCHGNYSTFSPELLGLSTSQHPSFVFGNVREQGFDQVLSSERYREVARQVDAGTERCRQSCVYFDYCGGGAPVNKLFENGTFESTETMFCRLTRQAPIDLMLEKLEACFQP